MNPGTLIGLGSRVTQLSGLLVVLLLAACGNDRSSADAGSSSTAQRPEVSLATASAASGTFGVQGQQMYTAVEVIRCIPIGVGASPQTLTLIARGRSDSGARAQLNVDIVHFTGTDRTQNTLDYSGPEGVFGNDGDAGIALQDGRVRGTVPVVDAETDASAGGVTFDVAVPDRAVDCSR